ncbi:MAG: hypothetical protein OCU12_07835 [Methanophagales archaeon]|nr:hypothetical protein [Methanophagales archaeon]
MIFHFLDHNKRSAQCDIVYHPGDHILIMSERDDNPGMSVTNACELIATAWYNDVRRRGLSVPKPDEFVWIEHYPANDIRPLPTYDRITFTWKHTLHNDVWTAFSPEWERIAEKALTELDILPAGD